MKNSKEHAVWLYRIIVLALGLILIAIELAGQSTPEVLVTLGSAAIGGLAGFLVPTHLDR